MKENEIDLRTDYEKMIAKRNKDICTMYGCIREINPKLSFNRICNAIASDVCSGTLTSSGVRKVLIAAGLYEPKVSKR